MQRLWITNGSTTLAPVVNPLTAACDGGYIPTDLYVLTNPGIEPLTESVETLMKTVVTAAGGEEPTIAIERIDDETDFEAIATYLTTAVESGQSDGAEIAIDVTPGRKFWSILSFRAGLKYDVDHLYYTHLPGEYFGELYPTIPRESFELIDFTEVI